jgi:hypothetical protein
MERSANRYTPPGPKAPNCIRRRAPPSWRSSLFDFLNHLGNVWNYLSSHFFAASSTSFAFLYARLQFFVMQCITCFGACRARFCTNFADSLVIFGIVFHHHLTGFAKFNAIGDALLGSCGTSALSFPLEISVGFLA